MRKATYLVVPLALLFCGVVSPQELSEYSASRAILARSISLPLADFKLQRLEERFGPLLSRHSNAKLIVFDAYATEQAGGSDNCKCSTDITFEFWKSLYQSYIIKAPMAAAQLLGLNGNLLLRVREPGGVVTTKVLKGTSLSRFQFAGATLNLLHVGVTRRQQTSLTNDGAIHGEFFLVTEQPFDSSFARDLAVHLQSESGLSTLSVLIRADPWFIREDTFPVAYPFLPNSDPPGQETYETSRQSTCVIEGKKIQCWDN